MTGKIEVLVKLYGPFWEIAGDGELKICSPAPSNLKTLLDLLRGSLGKKFEELLIDGEGNLQDDVLLLLNNRILSIRDVESELKNGDEISIIKLISGG
ncbi:MoaD/ThiS family protein [Candidatus Bathyarchaeota archaeon]|nr:MoaD/ThiS family protein [Candidatus Bathyarchaeota archaeon]